MKRVMAVVFLFFAAAFAQAQVSAPLRGLPDFTELAEKQAERAEREAKRQAKRENRARRDKKAEIAVAAKPGRKPRV